ncbi:MAG: hypothetical protein PUF10_00275 [Bacteroidales bacterium]|nr:hypothetical protein [Bacteroidales bacterium]
MEDLKQLLSCLNAESDVKTITETFEDIANILLYKSHIKTGHGSYRILEIEFYFKNNKHNDNVTIERTEEAGMWWLHDYGVDLSFKSAKSENYYGGILIRSMMPLDDNQINKEVVFGPRNCCWHLFYSSAIQPNMVPQIVMNDGVSKDVRKNVLNRTKRYLTRKPKETDGKYRNSEYRFYVKELNFKIDPNYKKASPWK